MIHPITPPLYETVCEWWKHYGAVVPPREFFPKLGFVAFIGEKPIIAAWLYRDQECAFSMMEWVIANPDSTHEEREPAFKELAEHIFEVARSLGAKIMNIAISENKKTFGQRLESVGFTPTDRNMTLYLKDLSLKKE